MRSACSRIHPAHVRAACAAGGVQGRDPRVNARPRMRATRVRHWKGQRYSHPQGPMEGRAGMPMALPVSSKIFTIFEGTSEIQRMIIGRAVTGLDVR